MWANFFTKPAYLDWNTYQARVTFINDFSLQQRLCRQRAVMLETF